jgi:hypothetical protein
MSGMGYNVTQIDDDGLVVKRCRERSHLCITKSLSQTHHDRAALLLVRTHNNFASIETVHRKASLDIDMAFVDTSSLVR